MAKTCIICNNPAGSGEHVFPAAFGGRRTNRGIYCGFHNNELGRHVSKLLNALDIINAIIGVIPDREKAVRPALVTTKDGEQYLFSKGEVKIAPPPPLSETPELVGKKSELRFADMDQASKWIHEQAKDGIQVTICRTGPIQTKIIAEPLNVSKVLGDEAFMRSILYLALTFLAHTYPAVARTQGLATVRDIVEKDQPVEDRVLWETPAAMEQLSSNPFPYGHTVAIGPIRDTNRIGALISFYGSLQIGVDLGETNEISCSECIATHIDPLAENPPDDIQVIRTEGGSLQLSSPKESREYLRQIITGREASPLASVLKMASEEELAKTCEALLPDIIALRGVTPYLRNPRILELLARHDQRIFSLMKLGIQGFTESTPDFPEHIRYIYSTLIAADESASRGLDQGSEAALEIARACLADAMLAHVDDGTLDARVLADLLGGGEGISIVLRTLTNILLQTLPQ